MRWALALFSSHCRPAAEYGYERISDSGSCRWININGVHSAQTIGKGAAPFTQKPAGHFLPGTISAKEPNML